MAENWYSIYTHCNAEAILQNSIARYSEMNTVNYETFLPLQVERKQWKDRVKVRKVPLFRNYLFVKHDDGGFHKIKTMKGFQNYVCTGTNPSIIPEYEIDMVRSIANFRADQTARTSPLATGRKVKICRGALAGYRGILIENQRNSTVAISIKSLNLCLSIRMPADHVMCV